MSPFDLNGKTAIVTGASRGLGAAATEALAEAGANVVLIGRESATLEEQASKLMGYGVQTLALRCDMGSPDDIRSAAAAAHDRFGAIDILVNNAGIIRRSAAE